MPKTFQQLLKIQKEFSDACFASENMKPSGIVEKHKTFCLSLHDEVAQLSNAVHYKDHRQEITPTDRQAILYEAIDVFRYTLATLNLWSIDHQEFLDAFAARDAALWDKKNRPLSAWSGQPVAIIDVDDVIARFRKKFFQWLNKKFDLGLTTELPEYYYTGPTGPMSGEEAFSLFIEEGGFRALEQNKHMIQFMKNLKDEGYWVQLLTARPSDNLKCMNDTYYWLKEHNVPYDNLAFSSEKYRWLSDKEFFRQGAVSFAVDDSPKHASEYSSHGIDVLVPARSYNEEVWARENVFTFNWESDDVDAALERLKDAKK